MRRALVVLVLLGLAGGGVYWWWHGHSAATEQTAQRGGGRGRRSGGDPNTPVPVVAGTSERKNVPIYLDALGTVQAFNLVAIHAMVDGPLVEVKFQEGQNVKAGDVLARVDPRPFQASLDAAVAKKQQDEANLANAKLDAARYAKLVASNYSSAQQADTARAQVAQVEAQVRGDQAQIDTARTQLSYATITAPTDGRVGLRQVDVGNIVHPGDATPITVLTQLQPISVVFTLPQQDLPQVARSMQNGMPEVLAVRAGATDIEDASVIDRGKLAVLDNQVDPATGTIKLKATFPNTGLKLWPGGFVDIRMLATIDQQAITVPTAAVQRGPQGPYVFVIKKDDVAERRAIKVGHEDDQTSIVLSGLEAGEQVVVDGAQRVTDGGKVAIAGPDGNAPDAVPLRERGAPGAAQRRRPRSST
ncbi:MAG: efflux RND transporter periplasmic adaptor subunit [Acetobacteraceae bacterium]|nr:efflux RND transporter periplasmic adaptor subunit [Acetobacteraceae bacterium]